MRPDLSPGSWFAARAQRTPHRRALSAGAVSRTYGEMLARVERTAGFLASIGVGPGARVGYVGANHPSAFELLLATSTLGAIFVPVNTRLSPSEIDYVLGDADPVVVALLPGGPVDREDLERGGRQVVEVATGPASVHALDSMGCEPVALPFRRGHGDDEVAVLIYTSGTTGRPKGAMLTNANLWWNNVNAMHALDVLEDDVALVLAPIFHIAGINGLALRAWQKGGEVVLLERFDPGAVLDVVEQRRVTTLFGVPTMLRAVAEHPRFREADLSSVRTLLSSGAPVPIDLLVTFEERGLAVHQGYGLTEAAPMVTMLGAEFASARIGSAGLPAIFCEVEIAAPGPAGDGVLPTGEILVRGPNVMKGYWNDPAATAEAIDDEGWLHTGDAGYLDDDGFLYVVDRVRDMIISGGENVYPAEVENVLLAHPKVREVAVVGEPDPYWGERVVAVVVPAGGDPPGLEELRDFAEGALGRFKLPQRLEVRAELPRSGAGKVLRRKIQLGEPADKR